MHAWPGQHGDPRLAGETEFEGLAELLDRGGFTAHAPQRVSQRLGEDRRVRHVQRHAEVDGLTRVQCDEQNPVDFLRRGARIQDRLRRGDFTEHPLEAQEITVEEGVVQRGAALHRCTRGHAGYVHDGYVFGVTAGDTVNRRQLTHPVGSDERAGAAADPGVSVRGVGGVELVGRSRPVDALYSEHFVE
jgi:hypothetical protein